MVYKQMAALYDRLMIDAPYDQWIRFTKDIFRKSGKRIKTIADLGCGTGEITIRLAMEGFRTFGVDYSADMLTYAEHKASTKNISIQWIHQDIRKLQGLENLDAAVSYCDVVNYITSEQDIKASFTRIADALKPGGIFIFDVHSLDYANDCLINHTFTEVSDDVSYIWTCSRGDRTGEMFHDLTFFALEKQGTYKRFDEIHHQQTYSIDFYKQFLIESGFEKPTIYSDFSIKNKNLVENAERVFFVTQKRQR